MEKKEKEKKKKKKEKFPLCVKAKVIGPFGAAAQKEEEEEKKEEGGFERSAGPEGTDDLC